MAVPCSSHLQSFKDPIYLITLHQVSYPILVNHHFPSIQPFIILLRLSTLEFHLFRVLCSLYHYKDLEQLFSIVFKASVLSSFKFKVHISSHSIYPPYRPTNLVMTYRPVLEILIHICSIHITMALNCRYHENFP